MHRWAAEMNVRRFGGLTGSARAYYRRVGDICGNRRSPGGNRDQNTDSQCHLEQREAKQDNSTSFDVRILEETVKSATGGKKTNKTNFL